MAERELFITTTPIVQIDGNKNIPTVLFYSPDGQIYIGSSAIEKAGERRLLNEDFKVDLGNIDPSSRALGMDIFTSQMRFKEHSN